MPILKYKCNECDTIFEELVLTTNETVTCKNCNSENITRHYQGKCYTSSTSSCSGSCSGCSGCK